MLRVVLMNGPRGVGKDEITKQYMALYPAQVLSISKPMKMEAIRALDVFSHIDDAHAEAVVWALEDEKDTPLPVLGGKTPRQVYIEYGNRRRQEAGETVFADMWLRVAAGLIVTAKKPITLIVPDCRFAVELHAAMTLAGGRNCVVVHVHRDGHTWQDDIGSYIDHDWTYMYENNLPKHLLGDGLACILRRWKQA